MRVLNNGSRLSIIPSTANIADKLDARIYSLDFSKMAGFYLTESSLPNSDERMYGRMPGKLYKIFKAFDSRSGNLGILLSGERGMGKSMFMRRVAKEAILRGLPVIKIDQPFDMLPSFIEQVDTPVVWLLDEFEKNFHKADTDDSDIDEQEKDTQRQFLSLLDGTVNTHHLFIVTRNDIGAVSKYFLNRPGRFYYHFEFSTPSDDDITEYLNDNLTNTDDAVIDKLLVYSKFTSLNFDMLKAIVQELNNGYELNETLEDLNIKSEERSNWLTVTAVTDTGVKYTGTMRSELANAKSDEKRVWMTPAHSFSAKTFYITLSMANAKLDTATGRFDVPVESLIKPPHDDNGKRLKIKLKSIYLTKDEDERITGMSDYLSDFVR